jgi:hypothetical protein
MPYHGQKQAWPRHDDSQSPWSLSPPRREYFDYLSESPSPVLPTPELSPTVPSPELASSPAIPSSPDRQPCLEDRRVDKDKGFKRKNRSRPQNGTRAVLRIMSPLATMTTGWTKEEIDVGRRLVRFQRTIVESEVQLSVHPLAQADYDCHDHKHDSDDATVISCILRPQAEGYCATSVDIICLLEMIEGADFEVEEKNRIRRNLEGLRPTT